MSDSDNQRMIALLGAWTKKEIGCKSVWPVHISLFSGIECIDTFNRCVLA